MNRLQIIHVEWNSYMGVHFKIISLYLGKRHIDSSLFGLEVAKNYLYVSILFYTFKVFHKIPKKRTLY